MTHINQITPVEADRILNNGTPLSVVTITKLKGVINTEKIKTSHDALLNIVKSRVYEELKNSEFKEIATLIKGKSLLDIELMVLDIMDKFDIPFLDSRAALYASNQIKNNGIKKAISNRLIDLKRLRLEQFSK